MYRSVKSRRVRTIGRHSGGIQAVKELFQAIHPFQDITDEDVKELVQAICPLQDVKAEDPAFDLPALLKMGTEALKQND